MAHLAFSLNAILPVFIMILLGYLLRRFGGVPQTFFDVLNKLVYRWLIPAVLFRSTYTADLYSSFSAPLISFAVIGTLGIFFGAWGVSSRLLPRSQVGSFTQACFRGNYTLMCVPLVQGIFGEAQLARATVMAPIFVALYSVLAVTVFTVTGDSGEKMGLRKVGRILLNVLKNPFIIAVIIGLPFCIFQIGLPTVAAKTVDYVATMATPAALIGIGGALNLDSLKRTFRPALGGALVKTLAGALVMVPIAVSLGFRGIELGILAVLFSTPCAVNCYPTALSLGGDGELAANSILISTLLSVASLVATISVLQGLGML